VGRCEQAVGTERDTDQRRSSLVFLARPTGPAGRAVPTGRFSTPSALWLWPHGPGPRPSPGSRAASPGIGPERAGQAFPRRGARGARTCREAVGHQIAGKRAWRSGPRRVGKSVRSREVTVLRRPWDGGRGEEQFLPGFCHATHAAGVMAATVLLEEEMGMEGPTRAGRARLRSGAGSANTRRGTGDDSLARTGRHASCTRAETGIHPARGRRSRSTDLRATRE